MDITWKKAQEDTGNIESVLYLCKKGLNNIRGKRGLDYPFKLNDKQRRSSIRGEVKIEKILLAKTCGIFKNDRKITTVTFKTNAAGLGLRKKGNIIADLFGTDEKGSPVAGEIKITHKNPWYATVESVAHVALMRGDRKNLFRWLQKELGENIQGTGAWGLVIAPPKYWKKKEIDAAKSLIESLQKKTKIRICCVSFDQNTTQSTDPVPLKVVCGSPPSTKKKL